MNLSETTRVLVNRYYKNDIEKGELRLSLEDMLYAEIDHHAFPSIVTNLIDNAIKYSAQKKDIELCLFKEKEQIVLQVKDQGCGISEVDKEKVFNKFFRAGNEETRRSKGTGLGLYIVNYIVKKHQAKLSLKNNQPQGSIFEIRFDAA